MGDKVNIGDLVAILEGAASAAPARAVAATPDPAGMAAALASVYPPG